MCAKQRERLERWARALLRAVNVGGTAKLPMSELKQMCEALGFSAAHTYVASGNVVFVSRKSEAAIKASLEKRLKAHCGKPVGRWRGSSLTTRFRRPRRTARLTGVVRRIRAAQ